MQPAHSISIALLLSVAGWWVYGGSVRWRLGCRGTRMRNSAGLVIAGNHCSLTKHDDADANMSIRRL
jgi:hypothetical protein